jgi:uncharacterized membrane protein
MMTQKIFHMNQSVSETRRRLKNIASYRHHLDGVDEAQIGEDGFSRWKLQLPLGFRAELTLEQLSSDEDVILFRSIAGNVKLMGAISFHEVKRGLTEIELVFDYEASSKVFKMLDRMLNIGDQFVVNQLRRVRAHFEGIAVPAAPRAVPFFGRALARV